MTRTSYVWQKAFEGNVAQAPDQYGRTQRLLQLALRRSKPDAAGSMVTTAGDYARFLTAILNATGKQKATVDEMLRPQVAIPSEQQFGPGAWQQGPKKNTPGGPAAGRVPERLPDRMTASDRGSARACDRAILLSPVPPGDPPATGIVCPRPRRQLKSSSKSRSS